ncbi:MAG TPA: hypothetical protein VFD71_01965, partial [Planctomycetota bacterium]|nr:hypothetical protein [Planctomycetota bacterium]
ELVAYLRENARVLSSEYRTEGVAIRAALSPARLGRFRSLFPEGFEGTDGADDDPLALPPARSSPGDES